MEPFDGPGYVSSQLTTFRFNQYKGSKYEVEFVKYILKEARVLKTATISVCDTALKESVIEEVSTFPRSSKTCLLTVEVQH